METKIVDSKITTAQKPILTANTTEHNFGNVMKQTVNTYDFVLTNTSDKSIIITNARASCGCTQPTYEKGKVLQPNETTIITANYTSPANEGDFHKNITVHYNWEIIETNNAIAKEIKQHTTNFIKLDIKGKIV